MMAVAAHATRPATLYQKAARAFCWPERARRHAQPSAWKRMAGKCRNPWHLSPLVRFGACISPVLVYLHDFRDPASTRHGLAPEPGNRMRLKRHSSCWPLPGRLDSLLGCLSPAEHEQAGCGGACVLRRHPPSCNSTLSRSSRKSPRSAECYG